MHKGQIQSGKNLEKEGYKGQNLKSDYQQDKSTCKGQAETCNTKNFISQGNTVVSPLLATSWYLLTQLNTYCGYVLVKP